MNVTGISGYFVGDSSTTAKVIGTGVALGATYALVKYVQNQLRPQPLPTQALTRQLVKTWDVEGHRVSLFQKGEDFECSVHDISSAARKTFPVPFDDTPLTSSQKRDYLKGATPFIGPDLSVDFTQRIRASQIDPSILLYKKRAAVTIANLGQANLLNPTTWNGHAVLILESVGKSYQMMMFHLRKEPSAEPSELEKFLGEQMHMQLPTKRSLVGGEIFDAEFWRPGGFQRVVRQTPPALRPKSYIGSLKERAGKTYPLSETQFKQLKDNINREMLNPDQHPIVFSLKGESVVGSNKYVYVRDHGVYDSGLGVGGRLGVAAHFVPFGKQVLGIPSMFAKVGRLFTEGGKREADRDLYGRHRYYMFQYAEEWLDPKTDPRRREEINEKLREISPFSTVSGTLYGKDAPDAIAAEHLLNDFVAACEKHGKENVSILKGQNCLSWAQGHLKKVGIRFQRSVIDHFIPSPARLVGRQREGKENKQK